MTVTGLALGSTQNFTLDAFGGIYQLSVASSKSWGFNNFVITETDPDGNVSTKTISKFNPFTTGYGCHVQFWISSGFEIVNPYIGVDVYLGLQPLRASFDHLSPASSNQSVSDLQYNPIGFSNVIFQSTTQGDAVVYISSQEEWNSQASNDWWAQLTGSVKSLFAWSWDQVLNLISGIPIVGPSITNAMIVTAFLVNECLFYIMLAVQNVHVHFLTFETLNAFDCMRYSQKQRIFNKFIDNHIKFAEWVVDVTSKVITTFSGCSQG